MKRIIVAVLALAAFSAGAKGMSFMEPLFVPHPDEVYIHTNEFVSLSSFPVRVACASNGVGAAEWVDGKCTKWFRGAKAVEAAFAGGRFHAATRHTRFPPTRHPVSP